MIPILSKYTKKMSFFAKVGALSGGLVGTLFPILQLRVQNSRPE